jgi:hypothetical protein
MRTKPYRRGNFFRVDAKKDGRVAWRDDDKGRWVVSKLLADGESNRFRVVDGKKEPLNFDQFVAGADPYKYGPKEGSEGGSGVFQKQNIFIDPDEKDVKLWATFRYVATYKYRHRIIQMFAEDMIMQCQYYGCKMAEETNVSILNLIFRQRGYGAYLHYFYKDDGMLKDEPGQDTQIKQVMDYIRFWDNYIELHGGRIDHPELIEELLRFEDDFRKFDMLMGCSIAGKAAMNEASFLPLREIEEEEGQPTMDDLYPQYGLNDAPMDLNQTETIPLI